MNETSGVRRPVERAVDALLRGVSVELHGLPGSGRTRTLQEICDRLEEAEAEVVAIAGISMPTVVPFASLASRGMKVPQQAGRADLYGAAAELSKTLGKPGTVLVVDDVDLLDEQTVGAILTARHRTRTPVLVSSRPAPRDVRGSFFSHVGSGIRIQMGALRHDEVDQLVRSQLQVAFEPSSLGVVVNACGGLPGLALSTTESLQQRGAIRRVGSAWRIEGPLWSEGLGAQVEQLLSPLGDEAMTALHLLAVAGTMTLEQARRMPGWSSYAALEAMGLVHVLDVSGAQELAVYPPLVGEYFNHRGSELDRIAVERLLIDVAEVVPRSRLVHLGTAQVSGWETTLVSHQVRAHWDDEVAVRRVAWLDSPSAWSARRYLAAMARVSVPSEQMAEVVRDTPVEDSGLDTIQLHAWWACHLGIVQQRVPEALDLLERERAASPRFDGLLRAVEAHIQLVTQRIPDPVLLVEVGVGEHPYSVDSLSAVNAEVLVARGLQRQAHAELDRSRAGAGTVDLIDGVTRGMAIFLDGDLEAAERWATEHYLASRSALDDSWSEGHAYTIGLILVLTGRMDAFDAHMASVASLASSASINVHMLAASLAFASVIATNRGQRDRAVAYAEQARGLGATAQSYPGLPPELALVLATEDRSTGGDAVWAATDQRLAAGQVTSAVLLGMLALEYAPDPERARALRTAAAATESPLLEMATRFAEATVEADPDGLRLVSSELAEAGLVLYATRAAVRASHQFRARGDVAAATQVITDLWNSLVTADTGMVQVLRPMVDEIDLTDREMQVAALLAQGVTAQKIADQLVLSVRTIEQHILRACRKLGVSRRADLAIIAKTWLSPFLR